jgi:signal recognition particle subunit SEC65
MADHFYVYPEYLIAGGPRSLGRRIPRSLAPAEVTLEAIVRASASLGYRAEAEPTKSYPRQAFRYAGRVKVRKQKGTGKTGFLRALATELRKSAGSERKG